MTIPMQPIRFTLTPKEAAQVHVALLMVVDVCEEAKKPESEIGPLRRALQSIAAELKNAGFIFDDEGWKVPERPRPGTAHL